MLFHLFFLKINLGISTFQLFTAMLDPLTLRSNFPYCQLYNSYNVSSDNLELDQLIIVSLILLFMLITYLVDIV